MTSLPKNTKMIKNLKIVSGKNSPQKKFANRPHARLGRIKSQDEKKHIPYNTNSLYTKNTVLNSILDKNFLLRKTANKLKNRKLENINSFSFKEKQKITLKRKNLNINKLSNIVKKEKKITTQKINSPNNNNIFNEEKLKTMSAKVRDINIDKNNLFSQNTFKLKKNFFENIKIKNIISLWNELEVLNPYRKYFFFIFKELEEEEQENLYEKEINELIELKNNIKNLTYNIELRTGIIKKLSELNTELNNEIKKDENKVNNFIINEMMNEIEKLNEQTINIVIYMKKIKTVINAVSNLGKYNIDILSQKFHFDKNYLIKMKIETNFLREGHAKIFFNIKNEESPFFLKACDKNKISNNDPFTKAITINENRIIDIKECNYYIYKELIAYQNEKANKKIFRCISPLKKNNSAYNYENIHFYNNNLFIIKDDKKENENEKEEIIINGSGLEINKDKNKENKIDFKKNSKNNLNNSAKLISSGPNFYPIDRKNKKLYTYNQINNNNIKKNSDIFNFKNNIGENKKYNKFLNNTNSDINIQNNPVFEISKKENDLPSFSPSNETKREKEKEENMEEDKKEE